MANLDKKGHLNSLWNPNEKGKRRVQIQDFSTDTEELVGLVSGKNRIKIASELRELGVNSFALRAGFGSDKFVPSDDDLRSSSEIARSYPDSAFAVCGPTTADLERVIRMGVNSAVIQTSTSEYAIRHRLKKKVGQLISEIIRAIEGCTSRGVDASYMASDSTRSHPRVLRRIVDGVTAVRCKSLVLSDSNGCATPSGIFRHVAEVRKWTDLPIAVHCHNDYGLATANALAGVQAGAQSVHTCATGIGERSGLAGLEEVVLGLEFLHGTRTGIRISKLTGSCNTIVGLLNYPVSFKKPVIGAGAVGFDGERLISALENLEREGATLLMMPYLPELVGNQVYAFLTAAAGPESVRFRLRRLGRAANEDQLTTIAVRCSELASVQGREVDDRQLVVMHERAIKGSSGPVPPYMLKNREAKPIQMFEGVVRRTLAEGDNTMAVEFRFKEGATVPLHKHLNEQIGYVASGEVDMTVAGTSFHLSAGDSYMVPGNVEHGTHAIVDSILVDVFHPPRLDYKPA